MSRSVRPGKPKAGQEPQRRRRRTSMFRTTAMGATVECQKEDRVPRVGVGGEALPVAPTPFESAM